jgi:beta-carotene 3-hydroxylase
MDVFGYGITFILIGFWGMELFSWFIHKYIMHGILWKIHKTHHTKTKGFFELNDVFSLLFGTTAVILIILGLNTLNYLFWIGFGITLYGFTYFVLHDILIHKRMKVKQKPEGSYLEAISKAHRDHHKTKERDGSVSFGLLIVPFKYFKRKNMR